MASRLTSGSCISGSLPDLGLPVTCLSSDYGEDTVGRYNEMITIKRIGQDNAGCNDYRSNEPRVGSPCAFTSCHLSGYTGSSAASVNRAGFALNGQYQNAVGQITFTEVAEELQSSAYDHFVAAPTRHSPGTSNPPGDSKRRIEPSTSFHTDSHS